MSERQSPEARTLARTTAATTAITAVLSLDADVLTEREARTLNEAIAVLEGLWDGGGR